MQSGNFSVDMPWYVDPTTGYYRIGERGQSGEHRPYIYANQEFRVQLSATLDPDPSISYGITVTDLGAPSSFNFVFSTPIVPTGTPNLVAGSVSAGLTDFTGNGVSITPLLADMDGDSIPEIQINELLGGPTNMGVDVGPAAAFTGSPPSYVYGPFTAGPQAGPAGSWTGLQSTVAFSLSGGGDVASITGFASVEQVPEPSTVALVAIGAMSLLGRFALRRRSGR